jgi:hypothetical protein
MEEWRAELAASIQGGLEESDEDEEWEQEQQGLITSGTKKRQSTEWNCLKEQEEAEIDVKPH